MKRFTTFVIFVVTAMYILSACAGSANTSGQNAGTTASAATAAQTTAQASSGAKKIGVSIDSLDNEVAIATKDSFIEGAKPFNYEVIVANPENSIDKQISDVEDLLSQDVDLLMIKPIDVHAITTALDAAKAKSVPVFIYFRECDGTPGEDFVTVVNMDIVEEGRRCANFLLEHFGKDQPIRVVAIAGTEGGSDTRDRRAGFKEIVDQNPNMEIIAEQNADFETAEAQKVMQNIIQSTGGDFEAVYSHTDGMAIGVVTALRQAGYNPGVDKIICSINGEPKAIEAAAAGEINYITGFNQKLGPQLMELANKYFNGEQLETFYAIPEVAISKENADQVYKDFWGEK